jgi:hypothetical protein
VEWWQPVDDRCRNARAPPTAEGVGERADTSHASVRRRNLFIGVALHGIAFERIRRDPALGFHVKVKSDGTDLSVTRTLIASAALRLGR